MTEETPSKKVKLRDLKKLYSQNELTYDRNLFTRSKANTLVKLYEGCNYFNISHEFDAVRNFVGEYQYRQITTPEEIELSVSIQALSAKRYLITADTVEPMECPICHKKKLYPTYILAPLSGLRRMDTVCLSCHEEMQYLNDEYLKQVIYPKIIELKNLTNKHI